MAKQFDYMKRSIELMRRGLSDTEIASQTILEPINQAIAFNFPGKGLKLGFFHKQLSAEDALTSSARVKNQ